MERKRWWRMTGWTESTLRAAASWKAFKEGKSLLDGGAVTEALALPSGWRGAVRAGKRMIRVGVTMQSASDLETRCSCPENQTTGELCCHAVAVGLATLKGFHPSVATSAILPSQPASPAHSMLLPSNWRDSLTCGKLTATLTICSDSEPHPADLKLANWLALQGAGTPATLNLHLDSHRIAGFLTAIAEHPRVTCGKERSPVRISIGHRLMLSVANPEHGEIKLVLNPDCDPWHVIGGAFWQIGPDSIAGAGNGIPPVSLAGVLRSMAAGQPALIPAKHLLENLDTWQDWLGFPENGWLDTLHFVPAPACFQLALDGSLQNLEATLTVSYGESPAVPPGCGKIAKLPHLADDHCLIRDFPAEEQALKHLGKAGFLCADPASGTHLLRGESSVIAFLTQILPKLPDSWTISESPRLCSSRNTLIVVAPRIEILGSGTDWLSFDLTFQTNDGNTIAGDDIRQLLRSGKPSRPYAKGRRLVISDEMGRVIEPLFAELDLHQKGGHYEASARSGEVIREISNKLRNFQTSSESDSFPIDPCAPTLQANLRPYQAHGIAWMLNRVERFGGALLADDMGLGKTLQAIAVIERLFQTNANDSGVVLVVATASLLGNWRAEFARFAPGRRVRILHGAGRDEAREEIAHGDVVLTSYGTLVRDLAWHLQHSYRAVVVDEASLMRNPDTDHARALAKLRSLRRIALTGTPIENGVRDLWSVFRFIQPGWLGSREAFRDQYEVPLQGGESAVMERLKLRIHPFLLRRTKEQVAPELPPKLFIDEFCDLSQDQQSVYRDLLIEGRKRIDAMADSGNPASARMQMLTTLLRLRQTCCDLALLGNERLKQLLLARRSAKLQRLLELLDEAISGDHKILVFSQFQKQLLEIEKCAVERGWGCLRLDGQTRNRQQMVEAFQSSEGPPVFLISLKAGGYGLNLTAADTVIHFDPWWNPAAEAQATDRTHRIGQTRPVTIYRMLTRGTVEEKVVRLQEKKRQYAATLDEAGGGDSPAWGLEDLKAVITGD